MQYVTLALAIIAGVAACVAAIGIAGWNSTKKTVVTLVAAAIDRENDRKAVAAAVAIEIKKREDVISMLKGELAQMEKDLAANPDPTAVRARIGQLLSSPS